MPHHCFTRRDFLQRSAVSAGSAAALAGQSKTAAQADDEQKAQPDRRPNILFLMADQFRFDCLAANGNRVIQTPNLDALAERSANFQNAFVQSPVCVPSRGSFFTGRYPHSHRNRVNYTPMPRGEIFIQQYLKEAGYETASVGKLHLYPPTAHEARRSGFSHVQLHDAVGRTDAFSDYVKWRMQNDPNRNMNYRTLAKDIRPGRNPFRAVIADQFTDTTWVGLKSREFLRQRDRTSKPFFLFSSFWKPHSPFEVSVPFDSMYNEIEIPLPKRVTLQDIQKLPLPVQKLILRFTPRYDLDRQRLQWIYRSYYSSISHVDREIGLILKTLEQTGQAENTIVVFSSDHGDQLLEHGLMGKNVFFESSVQVPFLFSFPSHVEPGKYRELIESVDLLPTLFEFARINEPTNCQGRSLARLVANKGRGYNAKDAIFSENIVPEVITFPNNMAFRFEKGKGVAGIRHPDAKMVRTQRWKLNYYPGHGCELYDLDNDPLEEKNLYGIGQHKQIAADLKERILNWMITADETDQIAEKWLL